MTATLKGFLDGNEVAVFTAKTSSYGNPIHTLPGGKYGYQVERDALPNGTDTVFSVGVDAEHSVTIPLVKDADSTAFRGEIEILVGGEPKLASAYINEVKSGYTIKLLVRNRPKASGGAKPKTAKDLFVKS